MRNIKKLVVKISVLIISYIIAMILILNFGMLTNPIISNKVALGQMYNDNVAFMAMDTYFKLQPIAYVVIGVVTIMFVIAIVCEIKKYISKTKENKKR
jgi:hypothetical protein